MPTSLFQNMSSNKWVPELSPRDMKVAGLSLIALSAFATSLMPLMPAGSLFGPISTKSLYMTGGISFHALSFGDESLFCRFGMDKHNISVAAPAMSERLTVPTASTFTAMPVFIVKSGNKWSNRPVSFVEVVETTTINFSRQRVPS